MKIYQKIEIIRNSLGIKQDVMADQLNISQSAYSSLETGKARLKYDTLEGIARIFNMAVIDVITYPKVYVDRDTLKEETVYNFPPEDEIKAVLQIELKKERKDEVLKMIFGDENLEILNK